MRRRATHWTRHQRTSASSRGRLEAYPSRWRLFASRAITPPRASRRACSSPARSATRASHPARRASTSASIAVASAASTTSPEAETSGRLAAASAARSASFPLRSTTDGADVGSCSIPRCSTQIRRENCTFSTLKSTLCHTGATGIVEQTDSGGLHPRGEVHVLRRRLRRLVPGEGLDRDHRGAHGSKR